MALNQKYFLAHQVWPLFESGLYKKKYYFDRFSYRSFKKNIQKCQKYQIEPDLIDQIHICVASVQKMIFTINFCGFNSRAASDKERLLMAQLRYDKKLNSLLNCSFKGPLVNTGSRGSIAV